MRARVLIEKGYITEGCELLKREVARNHNLVPNLGLLANAKIKESMNLRIELPALSDMTLLEAKQAVNKGLEIEPENHFLAECLARIESLPGGKQ